MTWRAAFDAHICNVCGRRRDAHPSGEFGPLWCPQRSRPPVEHYARCSVTVGALVIEPGLELRSDDDLESMTNVLAAFAATIGSAAKVTPRMELLAMLPAMFEAAWPGRAFFVEIHDAKVERWTQTFQAYGLPRSP